MIKIKLEVLRDPFVVGKEYTSSVIMGSWFYFAERAITKQSLV